MKGLLCALDITIIVIAIIAIIVCNTTNNLDDSYMEDIAFKNRKNKYFGFEDTDQTHYYTFDEKTGETIKILGTPPRAENVLDKLFKLIGWEHEQRLELVNEYKLTDGETILREYEWR